MIRSAPDEARPHGAMPAERPVWIDWGRHLRTYTLSRRLGADLVLVRFGGPRVWRYARSLMRTVRVIAARRPRVVIATNPSIVLGCFLLLLRRVLGFKLVSDAHYVGVQAISHRTILQRLLDFHNRRVDLVIVTNEGHARRVGNLGTPVYVCPDPLPDIVAPPASPASPVSDSDASVFLISSFDRDEPFVAAFDAFRDLGGEGFSLCVSGDYRRAGIDPAAYPWVRFLGFLPSDAYYQTLRSCAVVMDLTVVENCLVCGAYEALRLAKPLVLSDTRALREYFGDACVLTANTPTAIAQNVRLAFSRRNALSAAAQEWTSRNEQYMHARIQDLQAQIASLARRE